MHGSLLAFSPHYLVQQLHFFPLHALNRWRIRFAGDEVLTRSTRDFGASKLTRLWSWVGKIFPSSRVQSNESKILITGTCKLKAQSVPLEELRLGVSGGSRGVHWFMFTLALVWAIYVDARHVYRLEKLYLDNITVYITVFILYSCGDI